jgi:hypothetical protein
MQPAHRYNKPETMGEMTCYWVPLSHEAGLFEQNRPLARTASTAVIVDI